MSDRLVNRSRVARAGGVLLLAVLLLAGGARAAADERPVSPPRGDATAIAAGRALFGEHCARCHSVDAGEPSAEGPDLRRLDSFCRRLVSPALRSDCLDDVDRYFMRSVLEGKVRAGVVHMPAWAGRLGTDEIWAIRVFTQSLRPDPPRRATSVDRQRPAEPAH